MSKLINVWGDCQEYKCVKLYPFLMNDYELFEELISVLLFDKNKIPDIQIIKMSYLKFLLSVVPYMVNEDGKNIYGNTIDKIRLLLSYVLKTNEFDFYVNNIEKIFLEIKTETKNIILTEQDFDKIKSIILNQNAIPIVDNKMHPDLQKELEENIKFLAKRQGSEEGTIEDQIISYKCEMKFESYEPIKNMTIYQFRKELVRLDLIKDYQIYKTASMSGMVTFDKPIPYWRSHISNEPDYSGLLMDKNEFDKKMNSFVQQ